MRLYYIAMGLLFLFFPRGISLAQAASCEATETGVVVETVGQGSALDSAGVRPGDILLTFQRVNASPNDHSANSGVLESEFDWLQLAINQASQGGLIIKGVRESKRIIFEIQAGEWEAKVRPFMTSPTLDAYKKSRDWLAQARPKESAITLEAAAETVNTDLLRCWLLSQIGEDWGSLQQWEEAKISYTKTVTATSCGNKERAFLWDALGKIEERLGHIQQAETDYRKALELRKASGDFNLEVATSYVNLSRCAWSRQDLGLTELYDMKVLGIRERLAPNSFDLSRTLFNLGALSLVRFNLELAEQYFRRGLAISEAVAPDGLSTAGALSNLGLIASRRGQIDAAIEYQGRALQIRQKRAPNSRLLASSLTALGNNFFAKRRLDEAEGYYRQALSMIEKDPEGVDKDLKGTILTDLGLIFLYRYEFERAEDFLLQALSIKKKIRGDGVHLTDALGLLGNLEIERGNYKAAEKYLHQMLAIAKREAPGTMLESEAISKLGQLALVRNDFVLARGYYLKALELDTRLTPDSLSVSTSYFNLGSIAAQQNRWSDAISLYNRALTIETKLAPGSDVTAETLYNLGLVYRKLKRHQEAMRAFLESVEGLEAQVTHLGGTRDIRVTFREANAHVFRALVQELIALNLKDAAFQVLERSRGRSLLDMLAHRNLPALQLPGVNAEYELLFREAAAHRVHKSQEGNLLKRLRQAWVARTETIERLENENPLAKTARPLVPLSIADAQAKLDQGTLVLEYSIGADQSYLFLYSAAHSLEVLPLHIGEQELRSMVDRFRALLYDSRSGPKQPSRQRLLRLFAADLYSLLVKPGEAIAQQSKRLVIIPDGPLHFLPWGALGRTILESSTRRWQYLVEWRPIHLALSATYYAEIKRSRPLDRTLLDTEQSAQSIALFAVPLTKPRSPLSNSEDYPDSSTRALIEELSTFSPLPGARYEAQVITDLFPKNSRAYFEGDATEENAKSLPRHTRIVHFAAHATLDGLLPLNSAIVLSIPEKFEEGRDNGFLQAWEIFEQVRLDADLVVLSACESGLGKEMGGEGLIGLTRAFQYAGARSVMASLWKISDRTTAELMVRFYKHLKAGLPKDEALRAAQMELIQGPIEVKNEKGETEKIDASAPYYWAAFQIYGDWQ